MKRASPPKRSMKHGMTKLRRVTYLKRRETTGPASIETLLSVRISERAPIELITGKKSMLLSRFTTGRNMVTAVNCCESCVRDAHYYLDI